MILLLSVIVKLGEIFGGVGLNDVRLSSVVGVVLAVVVVTCNTQRVLASNV